MKRAANKYEFKETSIPSDFNFVPAISKPHNKNVPRNQFVAKMHKGASTRHGQQQSELKGQNKLLGEANEELQKKITETQEVQKTMKDLTEAREHLVQERENFSLEVEEMEKAVEDAEQLLLE
ncbi:unnamed protein product [Coregonus sp. 'balchen']|nr:unnamed protein product [Coregonus sp. 'balchen']